MLQFVYWCVAEYSIVANQYIVIVVIAIIKWEGGLWYVVIAKLRKKHVVMVENNYALI